METEIEFRKRVSGKQQRLSVETPKGLSTGTRENQKYTYLTWVTMISQFSICLPEEKN